MSGGSSGGSSGAADWVGVEPVSVAPGVPLPQVGMMMRVESVVRFGTSRRIYVVASYDVGNGLRDQVILRYEAFSFGPGGGEGLVAIPVDLTEHWE
jgi:hypothetical protein